MNGGRYLPPPPGGSVSSDRQGPVTIESTPARRSDGVKCNAPAKSRACPGSHSEPSAPLSFPEKAASRDPEDRPSDRRGPPELHEGGAALPRPRTAGLVPAPDRAYRAALRREHVRRLLCRPAFARSRPP